MSRTRHQRPGYPRHAPKKFRQSLNRVYRRRANHEVKQTGDVTTKKPKYADWEWF